MTQCLISFEPGQSLLLRVSPGTTLTISAVPAPQAFCGTGDVFAIQVNAEFIFVLTGLLVAMIPLCSQLSKTGNKFSDLCFRSVYRKFRVFVVEKSTLLFPFEIRHELLLNLCLIYLWDCCK